MYNADKEKHNTGQLSHTYATVEVKNICYNSTITKKYTF